MNERFMPKSRLGKLDHLIEECAEVTLAAQKLKRFGPGPNIVDGKEYPDNISRLHEEMQDLERALSIVRCIDLGKMFECRGLCAPDHYDDQCPAHGSESEELVPSGARHDVRSRIAQMLTGRCNNCYSPLPGAIGCSVHSPGWNWVTANFGPFCDECFKEVKA